MYKKCLAVVLLLLWVIPLSVMLYRLPQKQYGIFDVTGVWQQANTFRPVSVTQLGITASLNTQLVHVLAPDCRCTQYARQHISDLQHSSADILHYHRSAEELMLAGFQVPATPMVMLFRQGQLIYAGPYASGPLCSVKDSILNLLMTQQFRLAGTWFNGETKACRCVVTAA